MADVKQILVVDDHFEMLEFLRTILEHSGRDYQVLAVPSAEEGMLELLRTPFDLLITDVRLPGMSGFDLIRRVRRVRKELPVIMISGFSQDQGQQEANALGVVHYFVKPLDSDVLLRTVRHLLHGEPLTPAAPAPPEPVATPLPTTLAAEVVASLNQRLHTLRNEISATYLTLTDMSGRILTDSGIGVGLVSPGLLEATTDGLRQSQKVADYLGNKETFALQYHAGDKAELYALNVGEQHLLLIFFSAETRRGRVGTVWVFAQRYAKELLQLLPQGENSRPPATTPTEPPKTADSRGRTVPDLPDFPSKTPIREEKPVREERPARQAKSTPALPSQPVTPTAPAKPTPPTTSTPTPAPSPQPAPLTPSVPAPAFSFAEALRQGLIPGELSHGHDEPHAEESFDNLFDLSGETLPPADQLFALGETTPTPGQTGGELDLLDLPTDAPPDDSLADWLQDAAASEPLPGQGLSFAEALRLGLLPAELAAVAPPASPPEREYVIKTEPVPADESTITNMPLEEAQRLGLLPYDLLGDTDHEPTTNLDDLFTLSPDEAVDLDSFWDEAIADEGKTRPSLSLADLQALGVPSDEPTPPPASASATVSTDLEALFSTTPVADIDLDAFWDEAVIKEQDTAAASQGLSLEEARRKGLLGSEPSWTKQSG